MDIVILKGVQAHELRNLFQGLQFSMEPKSILVDPVNPEPPKLLPAPAGGVSSAGGNGGEKSEDRGQKAEVGGDAIGQSVAALDSIRKNTDLLPGILDQVAATPQRTAALVQDANREGREGLLSNLASGRLREKRAAAGRKRSVVNDTRDRKAIRAEVQRLIDGGLPHTESFRQASEQAQHGRAGQRKLTVKYDLPPTVATASVVRRVFESDR